MTKLEYESKSLDQQRALLFEATNLILTAFGGAASAMTKREFESKSPDQQRALIYETLIAVEATGGGGGGGGGDAQTANPLSQFAATTSLQLKGVISDETGSGALVFANTPTLVTPVLGAATATSVNGTTIPTSATLATTGANTFTGAQTLSVAGAASVPALMLSGVPFAGNGTTSFPLLYINDANAAASATLATTGTYFGVNGDGSQDLMNLLKDGITQFKVASTGQVTCVNDVFGSGNVTSRNGQASQTTLGSGGVVLGNGGVTNLSRVSDGVVGVGTGAIGSVAGSLSLTNLTASGSVTVGGASAASAPAQHLTGGIYTGGTDTTNFPHLFIQPTGATAATTWSTAGTMIGGNAATGFTGNFLDFKLAGATGSALKLTSAGALSVVGSISTPGLTVTATSGTQITFGTSGNTVTRNAGNGEITFLSQNASGAGWVFSNVSGNNATAILGLKAKSGQTGNLLNISSSSGTGDLVFIDSAGAATFSGSVTVGGALIGSVQSLSGPGAVNLTTTTTEVTSTGVLDELTLADGTAGQLKEIIHGVDNGSAVLTPTTATGFTNVTFTNAGDSVVLRYLEDRGWIVIASHGAVVA